MRLHDRRHKLQCAAPAECTQIRVGRRPANKLNCKVLNLQRAHFFALIEKGKPHASLRQRQALDRPDCPRLFPTLQPKALRQYWWERNKCDQYGRRNHAPIPADPAAICLPAGLCVSSGMRKSARAAGGFHNAEWPTRRAGATTMDRSKGRGDL